MVKIGIIGAAGYTGGELIRVLINHPYAQICFAHSVSNVGNRVCDVHRDLTGETEIKFSGEADFDAIDVLFLCVGHGDAKRFLVENKVPQKVKIIDLSQDFRLSANSNFEGREFVYGLPEMNGAQIEKANNIANPGCFATAIQLGLLPLAGAGLLSGDICVNALTGSTGAGQRPVATTQFSWRAGNVSVYNAFTHRHLAEVEESLASLMPSYEKGKKISFIPMRGDFQRGIFASIQMRCELPKQAVIELFRKFYADAPFTIVADGEVDLKMVVNTNKCVLGIEKDGDKLLVISVIDNLLKGAVGQAVENMNMMMGLDRRAGLKLKAVAF